MQSSYIPIVKASPVAQDLAVECPEFIYKVLVKTVRIPQRNPDVDKEGQRKKPAKDSWRCLGMEVSGTVRTFGDTVLERAGVLGGELTVQQLQLRQEQGEADGQLHLRAGDPVPRREK